MTRGLLGGSRAPRVLKPSAERDMSMLRKPAPLSEARQRLGEAIAAAREAEARQAVLDAALARARAEASAIESVVERARDAATHARAHAADHAVVRLMGAPRPPWPTPADAAATLAAAEAAEAELLAARRAILAEADQLRAGERFRVNLVAERAEAVLRDEMASEAEALACEIVELQTRLIDRGRALFAMSARNILAIQAPSATPAASAARECLIFAACDSRAWSRADASPTEARVETRFSALCRDASAGVAK